jgi:hypothetical protein
MGWCCGEWCVKIYALSSDKDVHDGGGISITEQTPEATMLVIRLDTCVNEREQRFQFSRPSGILPRHEMQKRLSLHTV